MRPVLGLRLICLLSIVYALEAAITLAPARAETPQVAIGANLAKHYCELADISSGICSIIGCDDSQLPIAMAMEEATGTGRFFVHVIDSRPTAVAKLRTAVDQAGLYGKQIVVEQGKMGYLPYASGMIDLLLAIDLTEEQLNQLSIAEIHRVLRPGGQAILGRRSLRSAGATNLHRAPLNKWEPFIDQSNDNGLLIKERKENDFGSWFQLTKPEQTGADTWSHWEHGPDNNPVSSDALIRAPYRTQWLGLPLYIAMPAITTSAGGKLYIAMGHIAHHRREEPWLNTLLARNAYNGSILWQRKLPDGYLVHRSAFVATDQTFYMIDESETGCLLLDPDTGQQQERISVPELEGQIWKWMVIQDGVLYVLAGNKKGAAQTTIVRSQYPHWSWGELSQGYYQKQVPWGFGTTILAYDLAGRKPLWIHREKDRIDSRAMVMGAGQIFYYGPDSHVGCLDAATGKPVWTNRDPEVRQLIEQPGEGLSSTPGFRSACFTLFTPQTLCFEGQTRMNVVALSTTDGKLLWQHRKTTNNPNMIYADERLYVGVGPEGNTLALDPLTGETLEDLGFKKRSCARLTATADSFFCRGWPEGLTRYDRKTGKVLFNGAFRPSCNDGVVPANGLLYVGPWACDCNLSVMGRVALCSAHDFQPNTQVAHTGQLKTGQLETGRLETAPNAADSITPLESSELDWPTYRGNRSRTAASRASVSGDLSRIWQFTPPAPVRPTAPTAAGGLIFTGGDDGIVRAIDATTGKQTWTFLTAGPILQPPTIREGRAYVGSGDGFVYALEAQTGRLLWRFHLAPHDRRIMAYGKLSSTWPVNSGVLVEDGVAYAAAGIVDYDDTYLCALDAHSGKLIWRNDSSGHLDPTLRKGISAQGTLTIARGRIWMAGGNVVSPAAYDLQTGQYVGAPVGDGSPQANRGEEIALFADRYLMLGGRLRYSAVRNVVNPGSYTLQSIDTERKLGTALPLSTGKITPAWDGELLVAVNGREQPLVGYSVDQFQHYLEQGERNQRPAPIWTTSALPGSDTLSVAIAQDAILTVCKTLKFRDWRANWSLCAWDREQGKLLTQTPISAEALPGGLLVNREGRVVVVLQDGRIACYGGAKILQASAKYYTDLARRDLKQRRAAIQFLRSALTTANSSVNRQLIQNELDTLGVHFGDRATKNGGIANWHILGNVPWDLAKNPMDKPFVGEPLIDIGQALTVGKRTLRWSPYTTDDKFGKVDLVSVLGQQTNAAAYAYAEIRLAAAADLELKIGSNDGYKCWFNGQEVGRYDGGRAYSPDQNSLPVHAQQGVNKILMKVTQMGSSWAFSVRLTEPSGAPVDLTQP
ncbi:MAG: PQQ-binding-like beta-propeller repeat protein [Pirellulales bacterium]